MTISVPVERFRYGVDERGRATTNAPETVADARDPGGRSYYRDIVNENLDRVDEYAAALRALDNTEADQNPASGVVVVTGSHEILGPDASVDASLRYDSQTGETRSLDFYLGQRQNPMMSYDSWGGTTEFEFDWNGKHHVVVSSGDSMTTKCWTIF
ncbi:MAG: hypothetical protein HY319_22790 [Armatimonadetes bacterium]|nr:hypothetical protein [Armatimonadota bacterium]